MILSLLFNQTCLNEGLLPNCTYFKMHDPAAHHGTDTQKYHCCLLKRQINYNKEKINTLKGFESTQDNFGKFIHQFQPETKKLIRKLERILIKLYRQNVSLLFNQTCLNEQLQPHYTYTHIYI